MPTTDETDETEETPPEESSEESTEESTSEEEEPKGSDDAAAAKWKALARKHEAAAKKERAAREKAEAANATDGEKAVAAARSEGAKAARERLAGRLLVTTVKALASDKMAVPARLIGDPDSVKRLLDLDLDDVVSEDGEVDEEAISAAIDALLAEEPDLAKTGTDDDGKRKGGAPKAPTGARSTAGKRIEDLSVEEMRKHLQAKKG